MKTFVGFHEEAEFLRRSSGSTNIENTLLKALKVFKLFNIPQLSLDGFRANAGSGMTVTDRETKVEVDLLPGGKKIDSGPLTFPMPTLQIFCRKISAALQRKGPERVARGDYDVLLAIQLVSDWAVAY